MHTRTHAERVISQSTYYHSYYPGARYLGYSYSMRVYTIDRPRAGGVPTAVNLGTRALYRVAIHASSFGTVRYLRCWVLRVRPYGRTKFTYLAKIL
eukprot:SAG31_NODE_244_length_19246_cov_20.233823_19_plen_96_part_00